MACSAAAWCDPPLRGGIRLIYGGSGPGSSGFVAKSQSNGVPYLLTAGHCTSGATGTWSTHFADGSSHNIGALHNRVMAPTGDAAILKINNPSGWGLPARRIRIQSDPAYVISSTASSSTVGQRICFTGSRTDSNCGTVTGGLGTRLGVETTYRANFCAAAGDSGGSIFSYTTAYGVLTGGYGGSPSCDTVYYDIGYARLWLNVDPAL